MTSRRRAFLIATALPVLALLFVQLVLEARAARRRIGVFLEQSAGGLRVARVEPGSPAASAGLQAGDQVTAVAGRPVASLADYAQAAARLTPGNPVLYQLQGRGHRGPVLVTPGMPPPGGRMAINSLAVLAYLGLALLALVQGLEDLRARLLFLFSLAVAVELALPLDARAPPALAVATLATYFLLTGLQSATELHLASLIPRRHRWLEAHPRAVRWYYAVGVGVGLALSGAYLARELGAQVPFFDLYRAEWAVSHLFLPAWAVAVAGLLLAPTLTHPDPLGRQQAALVLLGVVPWTAYVLTVTGLSLAGQPPPAWAPLVEPLVLLCYPVAVLAAIFFYHLFDLGRLVRRSLVYATLTTTLVLVFYGALGVGGATLSELVGEAGSIWVVGASTLLLGLLAAPLRRSLQRFIDAHFFPGRDALRRRLVALAGELPTLGALPAMGRQLVVSLCDIFSLRTAALLLAHPDSGPLVGLAICSQEEVDRAAETLLVSPEDPGVTALKEASRPLTRRQLRPHSGGLSRCLERLGADLAVPLIHQGQLVGLLLAGPRSDGRSIPAAEAELLALLSHHVAVVLENARLFQAATADGLTGLLRREAILQRLAEELQRARRHRRPLAVGMMDLDHFKEVNDRYGHLGGDMLLQQVSRALSTGLRSSDAIGRYGGEEFLLVLPETDLDGAAIVAEKVRSAVAAAAVETEDGEVVQVTISAGLASLWEGGGGEEATVHSLIAAADRALYRAKRAGRNRVEARASRAARLTAGCGCG